jgi:ABC-type nitrate/sulfonate/bicarbonate transport system permease component
MSRSLLSLASVFGGLLLWELCARSGLTDARFFPPPSLILAHLGALLGGDFLADLGLSLTRVLAGALIATPLAIALAVAGELSPTIEALLRPWISFLYPLPKVAIYPLLLALLGLGEAPKVALVALGCFFLVLLNAAQGVRRIMASEVYDVALVYDVPLASRVFRVLVRGAAPEIVNGVKLGVGYGLVMVISAEFIASSRGVGVFLWNSWDQFRLLDLWAALAVVSIAGWLLFTACGWLERRVARYD